MNPRIRRRDFIILLGGTAASPMPLRTARAQQPAMPIIGFLSGRSSEESRYLVAAFGAGLREQGFVEGQNVAIAFQWADGQYELLPGEAADLVRLRVACIVAVGAVQSIRAAMAATSTIPIVFVTGDDPVRLKLVASLNRPGGNVTGASPINQILEPKRLAFLHEVAPKGTGIAMLVNPNSPSAETQAQDARAAARLLGRELQVLDAGVASEIDAAFAKLVQSGAGALLVSGDPFFSSRREQIVALATRHKVPALSYLREFAAAGGLMSYGPSFEESYHQTGVYAGRILKGEKPADLPVIQPTKFDLVLNLKTARVLGLEITPTLLALADEVIE
jgi:putative tryptophan/tyrosine transport system substrate-binding protein